MSDYWNADLTTRLYSLAPIVLNQDQEVSTTTNLLNTAQSKPSGNEDSILCIMDRINSGRNLGTRIKMSKELSEFEALLQRIRDGSEDAASELLKKYESHIYSAVRRRLHTRLRTKFDSEDFVQAVWASFFTNLDAIQDFDRPEALVAFLAKVASNKVVDECRRRLQTEKSNIARERPLDRSSESSGPSILAGDPSPSQAAIANEQWKHITENQPSQYCEILKLRRNGETYRTIADKLKIDEKTVRRIVKRIYDRRLR